MNLRDLIDIVDGSAAAPRTTLREEVFLDSEMILEDRIDWMRKNIMPKLGPLADQEGITSEELFNRVMGLDPDRKKRYSQWLFRILLNKQGLASLDDLKSAPDVIAKFEEYKKNKLLSPEQSDINKYVSLAAVENTLNSIEQSQEAEEEQETVRAFAQSKVIHKDNNYLVVSPETEWAAKYWGRSSDWCTSYGCPRGRNPDRTENAFSNYYKNGELYVIYDRNKELSTHQLFIPNSVFNQIDGNAYELNDIENNKVNRRTENAIIRKIPVVGDLIEQASKNQIIISGTPYSTSQLYDIVTKYILNGDEEDHAECADVIEDENVVKLVLRDPQLLSYDDVYKILDITGVSQSSELDRLILSNVPGSSAGAAAYMNQIGRRKWEEYEKPLVESGNHALISSYAKNVDVSHWKKYKPQLVNSDPHLAVIYAANVIKREDPEVERIILKQGAPRFFDPIIGYVEGVGKGNWKEAETLLKNVKKEYKNISDYVLDVMEKVRNQNSK